MNNNKKPNKVTVTLIVVAGILVAILIGLMIFLGTGNDAPVETVPPTVPVETTEPTEAPTEKPTEAPTEPPVTEPPMLANMAELYEKNEDIAGWIRIDGTKIDYPFVHTPDEQDKYLYMDIEGEHSYGGAIVMDTRCTVDPESTNIILHGHNMKNGTMFNNLMLFEKEKYWKEHPTIYYSNLYEEREYEIIAAYRDRVVMPDEKDFKFYEFTDPKNEEEFNTAMKYIMDRAPYDTGIKAEFGDRLLLLVTCAYHTTNGRFIVVAREVTDTAE